jgi:hypothetical protein
MSVEGCGPVCPWQSEETCRTCPLRDECEQSEQGVNDGD